jgi:hypothetical protein
MSAIDLEPYGIFHTFKPSERIPEDVPVAKAEKSGKNLHIFDKTGNQIIDLTMLEKRGEGTSGTVFNADGVNL